MSRRSSLSAIRPELSFWRGARRLGSLFLALGAMAGLSDSAQSEISYDAYVVEPWDDSYQFATSSLGDINDLNVAVGAATFEGTTGAQFFWTLEDGKMAADIGGGEVNDLGVTAGGGAIWWSPGQWELIPHPFGGTGVTVRGLNNQNVVCGSAPVSERSRAFVWDEVNGSRWLEDLGVPATTWRAHAINDAGLLVGTRSQTGEPGDEKAFVLDVFTEETTDLHSLLNPGGSGITRVWDVSENGYVAGEGSYGNDSGIAGFRWSEAGGFVFLPGLNGGPTMDVHPSSVNDAGTVVGGAIDGEFEWRAFVWNEVDGLQDLEDLAELPDGFNLEEAEVINNNGWILGRGFWGSAWGPSRAVVFVPRPGVASVPDREHAVLQLRVSENPIASSTTLRFSLPESGRVRLTVHDVSGARRAEVLDAHLEAGPRAVVWDATDAEGNRLAPGVYFLRLTTGSGVGDRKVTVLR